MAVCSGCSACGTQDASQSTDSTATNLGFMSFPFLDLGLATRGAPAGSASVTIPGATRRAPANGAADRADACADRRTFSRISADRSAHSSHGRTAGGPAQRAPCHCLARRLPVIALRRIILRILSSRRDLSCHKNPSRRPTASHQTNHPSSVLLTNPRDVKTWLGERQWPRNKRPLLPAQATSLS